SNAAVTSNSGSNNSAAPLSGGNTYNFERMLEGATFIVREEADIKKLAVELGKYVKASSRRVGEL
ncbi:hypothetical protein SAMN04488576_1211, partial [Bacillus sp. cl25]